MIARIRIPGAWMWSAWQPDRAMAFNSYLFERGEGHVAVDPLPMDDAAVEWLASVGGLRTIVLTNRDHARAANELRARFGARVIAHAPEAPLFGIPIDATFEDGDEVFPGARAVALAHGKTPGEVALHLGSERCAVVGDALIGAPAGALSLLPAEKLADPKQFVFSLRRLWQLELDALLLGDGQPIFRHADDALAALLETAGGAEINRINAAALRYETEEPHEGFDSADAEVGLLIGARKLGYRLSRIAPGKAFCPMHSHEVEEEFYFVLEGTPSVRTPRGTVECRPGDFIAFPTGERGTHQLRNDSADGCLVLMVGANASGEVCFYPESAKVMVDFRESLNLLVRAKPDLDYFDGE